MALKINCLMEILALLLPSWVSLNKLFHLYSLASSSLKLRYLYSFLHRVAVRIEWMLCVSNATIRTGVTHSQITAGTPASNIRVQVQALSPLLPIQYPANTCGKAAEESPSTQVTATRVGDPGGILGSWLPSQLLQPMDTQTIQPHTPHPTSCSLSFFLSLWHSVVQKNKSFLKNSVRVNPTHSRCYYCYFLQRYNIAISLRNSLIFRSTTASLSELQW